MRKYWLQIILIVLGILTIGFIIGFFFGEKVYIWHIMPLFENADGETDMSIVWTAFSCVSTIFLAIIAVTQTSKANKIATTSLEIELSKAKTEEQVGELELINRQNVLKLNEIAMQNAINNEVIVVEFVAKLISESLFKSILINDYDNCGENDILSFALNNRNKQITALQIKVDNSIIYDKNITIAPNTSQTFRFHTKKYKKDLMQFEVWLKGNSNFITKYELNAVIDKHKHNIKFKDYTFIKCEEDTQNAK